MITLQHGILQSGATIIPEVEITGVTVENGVPFEDEGFPVRGFVYYSSNVADNFDIKWEIWDNEPPFGNVLQSGTQTGVSLDAEEFGSLSLADNFTDIFYPFMQDEWNYLVMWIEPQDPPAVSNAYAVTDL